MPNILIGEMHDPADIQVISTTLNKKSFSQIFLEVLPPQKYVPYFKPRLQEFYNGPLKQSLHRYLQALGLYYKEMYGIGSVYLNSFLPIYPGSERLEWQLKDPSILPPPEKRMMELLPPHTIFTLADIKKETDNPEYVKLLSEIMLYHLSQYPKKSPSAALIGSYHIQDFLDSLKDVEAVYGTYSSMELEREIEWKDLLHNQEKVIKHIQQHLKKNLPPSSKVFVF
ncbi:MAG: hypothetical protein GXN92_02625, partial [Candidatus Micrarchaeota archaeon]|nr:hypothetical protein [Candidatus Micrarchaeota archaeon]